MYKSRQVLVIKSEMDSLCLFCSKKQKQKQMQMKSGVWV